MGNIGEEFHVGEVLPLEQPSVPDFVPESWPAEQPAKEPVKTPG